MRKTVVQQQTPTAQYAQQTNMSYPQTQSRKSELRRSRANRVFAGVAGGLGEYFKVSPALIRFAFIVANFATGGTVLFVYLVLALVLPKNYDEWKRKK
jgi:phage shock protein PspC (stress-responsive transcriptional regulator)